MKQFKYLAIMLSAVLALWSCSDDDNDPTADVAGVSSISLSSDTIQVTSTGGTATVTVTSESDWRLAGVSDWVHPSVTEGKSGAEVTFTIDESPANEARTALFKFFCGSSVAPLLVESNPNYVLSFDGENVIEATNVGGDVIVRLNTNIADLSVECGEDWLSLAKITKFGDERIVLLDVSENATFLPRSSSVKISSPLVEQIVDVTVKQAPTEKFELTNDLMQNNQITCDLNAQDLQFKVVTNLVFEAQADAGTDWIGAPVFSEPQVGDDGLSTYTVTFSVEESSVFRTGNIIFTDQNEDTYQISVIQKDPNMVLFDIPDSNFATFLSGKGWIAKAGTQYYVTDEGKNATELNHDDWRNGIRNLTGIENFPNLTRIKIAADNTRSGMTTVDLSGLHKVESFSVQYGYRITSFNFGDNPIKDFVFSTSSSSYTYARTMIYIGEHLESLDAGMGDRYSSDMEVLDVSGCPSLKYLKATTCGVKFKTIILKEGQVIDNIEKGDGVTIEYK